jgi:hypothetical protein
MAKRSTSTSSRATNKTLDGARDRRDGAILADDRAPQSLSHAASLGPQTLLELGERFVGTPIRRPRGRGAEGAESIDPALCGFHGEGVTPRGAADSDPFGAARIQT